MPKGSSRIQVTCPACQTTLVVDPKTGLVLHSAGQRSDYSFEEALNQEHTRKEKTEELFQQAFQEEEDRRKSLEGKFREALDSQDELEEPINPLELD